MTYQDIRDALCEAGLEVWNPAARQGVCLKPYVVVQDMGTYRYAQSRQLVYTLIAVHCYVPLHCYDELALLTVRVRNALSGLAPDLRPVGGESVHIINDRFQAHETYLEYVVQKKA